MESAIQTNSTPDPSFLLVSAIWVYERKTILQNRQICPVTAFFLEFRLVLTFIVRLGDSKPLSEKAPKTRHPFDRALCLPLKVSTPAKLHWHLIECAKEQTSVWRKIGLHALKPDSRLKTVGSGILGQTTVFMVILSARPNPHHRLRGRKGLAAHGQLLLGLCILQTRLPF